jgi:RNA polymerase sigma-70 factor (ECF subfamily)
VSAALPSDELLVRRQRLEQAGAVLQQLDDGLRDVLLLFALEETPTREIAEFLQVPVGTVKSRLRRARAQCLLQDTYCAALVRRG